MRCNILRINCIMIWPKTSFSLNFLKDEDAFLWLRAQSGLQSARGAERGEDEEKLHQCPYCDEAFATQTGLAGLEIAVPTWLQWSEKWAGSDRSVG